MRDDATRPPNRRRRDPLWGAVSRADDLTILIADDDPSMRFLLALELRNRIVGVEILQAADGADAAALGLRHHPHTALLDVCMPRLNGIEAAFALHKAQPKMKVALQSGDAAEHRDQAAALGIPLFDKRDLEPQLAWIKANTLAPTTLAVGPVVDASSGSAREQHCSRCGYRISSRTTPARCRMCQTSNASRLGDLRRHVRRSSQWFTGRPTGNGIHLGGTDVRPARAGKPE